MLLLKNFSIRLSRGPMMTWHVWSFEEGVESDSLAGETLLNILQMVIYIFADFLAGEPLLPRLRCPLKLSIGLSNTL